MTVPDDIKILIVDDEIHIRIILKAYLSLYNVSIVEASDGEEALEILRKEPVDLVILDYNMPVMNGQEVINRIQVSPELSDIPVILYTAGGFARQMETWLKNSTAAFLEKGSIGEDIIPTIKDIFGPRFAKKT